MFVINDDMSIYVTRGDAVAFTVTSEDNGESYEFQSGDMLRFKVYGKKNAENVVLQEDFTIPTATKEVEIYLTEEHTKFGGVISKPTDYWYEVELNPTTNPQTIIGYDEDGAKVFRLFPEGRDLTELEPDIKPEDIPVVDKELDMTSLRPVQNQAIARAVTRLDAATKDNKAANNSLSAEVALQRERLDNLVAAAAAPVDADASYLEVADIRVGADGRTYPSAGAAIRGVFKKAFLSLGTRITSENYADVCTDANNFDADICFINGNITKEMVANLPYYGTEQILMQFKFSEDSKHGWLQLCMNTKGDFYTRMEWGYSDNYYFSGWNRLVDEAEMLSAIDRVIAGINKPDSIATNTRTCKIFRRVCCCGDSYTSGHIVYKDGTSVETNEDFAWPRYMSTLTGNEWVNCGRSGANVLTWQTWDRGLSKAKETGKVQAYVIGLMINDTAEGTPRYVPVGTAADIGTNAETYYGGMSKIIRELNAISPKAKIFVQTCPKSDAKFVPYNQAVRDIVEAYKNTYPVHCLDLFANIEMYQNQSLTEDSIGGHYTAIAYEQFAEILAVIMSDYINEHIDDFQDVHLIEYDR